MSARLSQHAQEELQRRGIPRHMAERVLAAPEQKVPGHGGLSCYQSRVSIGGKPYLLRVIVDEAKRPPVAVTVYRTSKIAKYWAKT